MWRSVLLHEFPDEDIRSLQALRGDLTPDTLALNPYGGGVLITPGRGFRYILDEPLRAVIGVSCRIQLHYPLQPSSEAIPIIRLGDGFELTLLPVDYMSAGTVLVRLGDTELALAAVGNLNVGVRELRFDWHTSGQAYLRADGWLIGYHNALSPGTLLNVADVTFGFLDGDSNSPFPRYDVVRVFVRALSWLDSLVALSRELPPVDIPDDDLFERCRLWMTAALLARLNMLRGFMTQVNHVLSQPWSQDGGPAEGPFKPEAILAHDLATTAAAEFRTLLRSGDFSTPDDFLVPFTQFLEILHHALPAEFEGLVSELGSELALQSYQKFPKVPEECRAVFEELLAQNEHQFAPLLDLLKTASDRVTQIAEVG